MAYYLNSYRPLIWTWFGQQAVMKHGLPRFIDASCRREPDFENPFPSMTAICRGSQGAVRLQEGDYVAYVTVKLDYEPAAANGRYLVGGFKVLKRCTSHDDAAAWYRTREIALPSNCFIEGNTPLDFDFTGGYERSKSYTQEIKELVTELEGIKSFGYAQKIRAWDAEYWKKVERNSTFIITEPIKCELVNPVQLTSTIAEQVFGPKFPNTRSLRRIDDKQFWQLMDLLSMPE